MGKKVSQRDLESWLCRWPGVTTDVKWGSVLCFLVRGKMFCVYRPDGAEKGRVSFKVGEDRFLEMTDRPGFEPAPYPARSHWVKVADTGVLPREELQALLRDSYELIVGKMAKKVQKELLG